MHSVGDQPPRPGGADAASIRAWLTGAEPMRHSTLDRSVRAKLSFSRSIMAIIGGTAVSPGSIASI